VDKLIYFAAARDICRRHAKSFFFASRFLPEPKRSHVYAVFAFCRLLDDAVDELGDPVLQMDNLIAFDDLLDGIYAGRVPHEPTERDRALRAFEITVRRCRIPKRYFEVLAEGSRMDLSVDRYADWPALENYCFHVAGVMGLIMCCVFSISDSRTHDRAVELANAMQLTTILRDVGADFGRGRVYLPTEEMAMFGCTEAMLSRSEPSPEFAELMKYQITRARDLFFRGCEGLAMIDSDGSRFTAALLAALHGGLLGAIERSGYNVLGRRIHLSTWQKFARLPAAMRLAHREHGDALPDVF